MPLVGGLGGSWPTATIVPPFRQGLKEAGYVEGQNVAIESRFAEGQYDRLPALAIELVSRRDLCKRPSFSTGHKACEPNYCYCLFRGC